MITVPTENPNVPENLKKEIESVRNQISLGEAELIRLSELAVNESYKVGDLVKEKSFVETQISEAEKNLEVLKKKVAAAEKQSDELEKENARLEVANKKLQEAMDERTAKVSDREEIVLTKERHVVSELEQIAIDRLALNSEKELLEKKISKIQEAIKW